MRHISRHYECNFDILSNCMHNDIKFKDRCIAMLPNSAHNDMCPIHCSPILAIVFILSLHCGSTYHSIHTLSFSCYILSRSLFFLLILLNKYDI